MARHTLVDAHICLLQGGQKRSTTCRCCPRPETVKTPKHLLLGPQDVRERARIRPTVLPLKFLSLRDVSPSNNAAPLWKFFLLWNTAQEEAQKSPDPKQRTKNRVPEHTAPGNHQRPAQPRGGSAVPRFQGLRDGQTSRRLCPNTPDTLSPSYWKMFTRHKCSPPGRKSTLKKKKKNVCSLPLVPECIFA